MTEPLILHTYLMSTYDHVRVEAHNFLPNHVSRWWRNFSGMSKPQISLHHEQWQKK